MGSLALGFALIGWIVPSAQATGILSGVWYTFQFGGTGSALDACTSCTVGNIGIAAPSSPWTISLAGPFQLIVTDGFAAGDRFQLFDNNVSLGSTNAVADSGVNCDNNVLGCLANPAFSHGTFLLGAGNHSLTGIATVSPFGGGAGFFIIRAVAVVPEPGSLALIALGLGILGFTMSRSRRV
ncbi:MAG: PEP-CTERM sorting domain-containing protein [Casimicrobiaceae bacterium]